MSEVNGWTVHQSRDSLGKTIREGLQQLKQILLGKIKGLEMILLPLARAPLVLLVEDLPCRARRSSKLLSSKRRQSF